MGLADQFPEHQDLFDKAYENEMNKKKKKKTVFTDAHNRVAANREVLEIMKSHFDSHILE